MNTFNQKEFEDICSKLNNAPFCRDVILQYSKDNYFNKVSHALHSDRRGEVVFCVIRPNGKVISITCTEYPEGIFRIPTGGIGHQEDILEAVHREVKEELGLEVEMVEFSGVLKIRFEYENNFLMFYSYLFIMKEISGRLLEDASDDEISEVLEVDLDGLDAISQKLLHIKGKWADWGRFRYETTHAILECLKQGRFL